MGGLPLSLIRLPLSWVSWPNYCGVKVQRYNVKQMKQPIALHRDSVAGQHEDLVKLCTSEESFCRY